MRKFLYLLMAGITGVALVACSSDEEPSGGQVDKTAESTTEEINPNYLAIDWTKTSLYDCEPNAGTYSFSLNSETEKVVPGSVITIDADTMGYVVIVKSVTKDNGKVTISADQGDPTDVFANSQYVLATGGTKAAAHAPAMNGKPSRVVYPSETFVQDARGNWEEVEPQPATAHKAPTYNKNIVNWSYNLDNKVLYSNKYAKVYLKEANIKAAVDVDVTLSFGPLEDLASYAELYKQYKSKSLAVTGVLNGSVAANVDFRAEASGKASLNKEDELWKQGAFKPIRKKFLVPAGNVVVPVWITFTGDIYRGCDFEATGSASLVTGVHSTVNGSLGFNWSQQDGIKPIKSLKMDNDFVFPSIEGKGKVTGNVRVYPRIRVALYDAAGPLFDVKPYARFEAAGGFKQQFIKSSNTDYIGWQLAAYVGLKANTGLNLQFLKFVKTYTTDDMSIVELPLYESPTDIQFDQATGAVQKGVTNTVSFKVFDKAFNYKAVQSYLPQIVKFDGDGKLSTKYAVAIKGVAKVDWTPASNSSKLKATIYGADGKAIKTAVFAN